MLQCPIDELIFHLYLPRYKIVRSIGQEEFHVENTFEVLASCIRLLVSFNIFSIFNRPPFRTLFPSVLKILTSRASNSDISKIIFILEYSIDIEITHAYDKAEPRSDRREFDTYEWRKVDRAAGNEPRRGASIGSLDGRRYTRPHTNVSDMFLWASQHGVKCRTTPRRVLVTHGTLCCREPLITDAESISISHSFTTCDAVYANRTFRDSPCLGLPGNWLACVTACGSTDLRIRASISTILGMVPGRRLQGS